MSDSQQGPCFVCTKLTIHRCDHTQRAQPWVCVEHRHAIHLACLLRGEFVESRFLEDDLRLLASEHPDETQAEALRKGGT